MKNMKKMMSLLLIAILAMSMALTGCKKNDSDSKDAKKDNSKEVKADNLDKLVVTIDDTKLKLQDLMYFIYDTEYMGAYYSQMYGSDYWSVEAEEGVTYGEQAKDYIIDNAVMVEIMSQKAKKEKLALTDEEIKKNKENVKTLLKQVTKDQLKLTGFTEDNLLAIMNKIAVASKYYDQLVKTYNIDEDAIKASIKKEDYKQYDTSYMYFPTLTTNDSGQAVAISDDEKKKVLKTAEEALAQIKKGKSFDDIKDKFTTGMVNTLTFTDNESDTNDADYKAAAKGLKVNGYSDIVETSQGYFIIQLTSNTSEDSYNAAVDKAITSEQSKKFNANFKEIKKDYKITTNKEVWDTIVMGKTTIVAADTSSSDASTDTTATKAPAATDSTATEAPAATDAADDGANE